MLGRTHALVGAAAAATAGMPPVSWPAAALGALLPDLDASGSVGSRLATVGLVGALAVFLRDPASAGAVVAVAALAWAVRVLPHRGPTHSLLGAGAVAGALWALGLDAWAAPVGLGYLSHLVADGLTGTVPVAWPLGGRVGVRLARSGGWMDVLATGIAAAVLAAAGFGWLRASFA